MLLSKVRARDVMGNTMAENMVAAERLVGLVGSALARSLWLRTWGVSTHYSTVASIVHAVLLRLGIFSVLTRWLRRRRG
jgi:uncharacterized membrane protein YeaQ/YmgE (transglycosylase-associated protein family)